MFSSIINEAQGKFNSGGKAGDVFSALLEFMANPAKGGFRGFIEKFYRSGSGDTVESWIQTGGNRPISNERIQAVLGANAINSIAEQAGVDRTTTTTLLGFMIPRTVDALTPNGEIPDEASVVSKISDFSDNFDSPAIDGAMKTASSISSGGGFATLRYVLPILLLALLVGVLGYWLFKPHRPTAAVKSNQTLLNPNPTVVKIVESSFKIEAKDGKYAVSGLIPDLEIFDKIKTKLTTQFGAENINFVNLRVEPGTKPFADGWWINFSQMLPTLKNWNAGTLGFKKNSITEANGLPSDAIAELKSLFEEWTMPASMIGAENTTKQSNKEALKELDTADTVEKVIAALNNSIINFKSGGSEIPSDAKPILAKAAEILKKQLDGTVIEIGGYTDSAGDSESNRTLSQSRAEAVKKVLIGLGVKDSMLKTIGYGDVTPIADNNTEDGRFSNRRIEYKKADGNNK